jgi:hypothetical protein
MHAWTEYHAGRIVWVELARVLAGIGQHPVTRDGACQYQPWRCFADRAPHGDP